MGWTSQHRPKGISNQDFFQELVNPGCSIVKCATIANSEFYAAVSDASGLVSPLVVLIRWSPTAYFNFSYKDMGETMGPNACRCPDSVLSALSSLEELGYQGKSAQWASEWRDNCARYNERLRLSRSVRPGDVVRFDHPITFTDGVTTDTFTFSRGSQFRRRSDSCRCRISRWRERSFVAVAREVTTDE